MTPEEAAIERIEALRKLGKLSDTVDTIVAIEIAIEALKEIQQYRAIGTVEECKKAVKEEDALKFYYCESEDDYYIGKRVGNFYYARYGETGFEWFMSRYLPWGEHVVKPNTLWKEYTYPSEPKEIPFVKWIEGFIRKYISGKDINVTTNNGWFPVDKYGFPKDEGVYDLTIIDGLEEYVSVRWQFLSGTHLSGTQHYVDGVHYWADNYRGDPINEFLSERVIAWRKKPEPYRPVQDTAGGHHD